MIIHTNHHLLSVITLCASDLWQGSKMLILEIRILPSFRSAYMFFDQSLVEA